MIAESRTEEKDVMVKVVVNLINRLVDILPQQTYCLVLCLFSIIICIFAPKIRTITCIGMKHNIYCGIMLPEVTPDDWFE